jgi:hypothetical protein
VSLVADPGQAGPSGELIGYEHDAQPPTLMTDVKGSSI